MEKDRIEIVLDKYWLCQTTLLEEEELRLFFAQKEIPEHLVKYRQLFSHQQEEAEAALNDTFDERILNLIDNKKKRIFPVKTYLSIAAMIIIIVAFAFTFRFYKIQHDPWQQDTFETPEQALVGMRKIFSEVAVKMDKGKDMVSEKMQLTESVTNLFNFEPEQSPKQKK